MAVPKKRKKLAETSQNLKKRTPGQTGKKKTGKTAKKSTRKAAEKIENAFEIMQHIENDNDLSEEGPVEKDDPVREKEPVSSSADSKRQGFRFHISLDALMPDKEEKDEGRKSSKLSKSALLDIGVTIPFFWKFPVIGGIAKKVVKNIKTIKF